MVLAATLASLAVTVTLTGCVKAQGPVVQGSIVQGSTAQGPFVQGSTAQGSIVQGAPSQSSGNPNAGSTSGAQGSGNNQQPGAANSGAEPQAGAVVVEAIRKGPLQPNGTVTHLVDGDTVDVAFTTGNGKSNTERIRLIGIDTPETKRPNTPVECFGREASSALAALIPIGTTVLVERDVEERDRYGRLLGYVFRASDGLFVNHEMVRAGMATPYTFPPNIAYVDVFAAAGDASRAAAVGLWSRCESGHESL